MFTYKDIDTILLPNGKTASECHQVRLNGRVVTELGAT